MNCIITLEEALSGAPLLVGRDGVWRDLSRVRGSYHPVAATERVADLIGRTLAAVAPGRSSGAWIARCRTAGG